MGRSATILVSACLLGINCRYDGTSHHDQAVISALSSRGLRAIPVCPEQLGGLPTPRPKVWFRAGDGAAFLKGQAQLIDEHGKDVGSAFFRGAEETLKVARLSDCTRAILKQRSPSCGSAQVHCNGQLVDGVGVTCALLQQAGIEVSGEENLDRL